jgi:hypothetical protein
MGKEFIDLEMDKKKFSVVSLSNPSDDKAYWFSVSPMDRIRHIEVLRRINYGHRASARLQRVLEITNR